ncbi:hypothetical protein Nepgr_009409 [Nepenthes gracilis]|uniref:Uncharacterized protein n=1 Tax=Nepenthes gracilis TaxID=150966 RepID=A0AAD3SBE5_NEPGR|nr:hypothetical protein Nepgr_009409 [Nepenthes gracilis]
MLHGTFAAHSFSSGAVVKVASVALLTWALFGDRDVADVVSVLLDPLSFVIANMAPLASYTLTGWLGDALRLLHPPFPGWVWAVGEKKSHFTRWPLVPSFPPVGSTDMAPVATRDDPDVSGLTGTCGCSLYQVVGFLPEFLVWTPADSDEEELLRIDAPVLTNPSSGVTIM